MISTTFGESKPVEHIPSEFKENKVGAEVPLSDIEPVDSEKSGEAVLQALGIDDVVKNLPENDRENLQEVDSYIKDMLKAKGIAPTKSAYSKALQSLRENMGIDEDAEPSIVLDRVGGVMKSWKALSFITDAKEKRSLFYKLAKLETSEEMNKEVFRAMERNSVWR